MSNSALVKSLDQLLAQTVAYVERTQPQLDIAHQEKRAAEQQRQTYVAQARNTAHKLAELGVVNPAKVTELADKLASDGTQALALLLEVAQRRPGTQSLGTSAVVPAGGARHLGGYKVASDRPLSASDRAVLYGDPNADPEAHMGDGMLP